MAGMPLLSDSGQIVLIAASAIGFDFAVQAALVAHQSIVYGIEPAARSRLNALLYTGIFIGMAAGAFLGSVALAHFGWTGVVVLATASSLAALAVRALTPSQL
jgi:predicted MFS family arabinose efflux permease